MIERFHNNVEGHHGIHRTVGMLHAAGYDWPKMGRDVTEVINQCVTCQKNRPKGSLPSEVRGTLRQYTLFAEVAVDFIGPLPRDQLDNSYICGITCGFSGYTEAFPVEAATAVVAAHCLVNVFARYSAPSRIRSDRGTHFVNEVITELLRLFKVISVLTPPYRPQANGIEERTGGEVVRHLRGLVEQPEMKGIWSVVLPLAVRIVNHTFRSWLGCRPSDLVTVQPWQGDRGLLDPCRPMNEVNPITSEFLAELHYAHELMLDETSRRVLAEQQKLEEASKDPAPRAIVVGELVLVRYPVQPPSKLHSRVCGPFRVTQRVGNLVWVKDLTCNRVLERDAAMLIPFLQPRVTTEQELVRIAAQDMGETEVEAILKHRGPKTKEKIKFLVQWSDGDSSWERWPVVQKLKALDEYLERNKDLKGFTGRKTLGAV